MQVQVWGLLAQWKIRVNSQMVDNSNGGAIEKTLAEKGLSRLCNAGMKGHQKNGKGRRFKLAHLDYSFHYFGLLPFGPNFTPVRQ